MEEAVAMVAGLVGLVVMAMVVLVVSATAMGPWSQPLRKERERGYRELGGVGGRGL